MVVIACTEDSDSVHLEQTSGEGRLVASMILSGRFGNGAVIDTDEGDGIKGLWTPGRPVVTAVPLAGSAADGDVVILRPPGYAGIAWELMNNPGNGFPNPWELIGGSDIFTNVEGTTGIQTDGTPTGAWSNGGGTPGPDITVPYGGVYDIFAEASVDNDNVAGTVGGTQIGVAQGTAATPITALTASMNSNRTTHILMTGRQTLTAGTILRLKYRNAWPSNLANFSDRRLRIRPVRL